MEIVHIAIRAKRYGEYVIEGTIENSSEITISLSFTAEYAESAEVSGNPARIETVLKLCTLDDLRGDKSLDF